VGAVVRSIRATARCARVSSPAYDPNLFARKLCGRRLESADLGSAPSAAEPRAVELCATRRLGVQDRDRRGGAGGRDHHAGAHRGPAAARRSSTAAASTAGRRADTARSISKERSRTPDVYFYGVGQKLGIERIAKYARLFDLGSRPDRARRGSAADWCPTGVGRCGAQWYAGETISVAIGRARC
jgi:hypothetical protein